MKTKSIETRESSEAGEIVKTAGSAQSDIREKVAQSDCDIDYYNAVQSGKIGKIIAITVALGTIRQSEYVTKYKGGVITGKGGVIAGMEPLAIYPGIQKMPVTCFQWETLKGLRIRYNRTKGFMVAIFRGELVASSGTSRPCFVYGPWFKIIEDAYQTMMNASITAEMYRRPEAFIMPDVIKSEYN
jgi:hypothetical protein